MALRLSLSSSPPLHSTCLQRSYNFTSTSSFTPTRCSDWRPISHNAIERRNSSILPARSSSETATGAVAVEGKVTEVDKDTFWPIVESAGEKVVVLDMYTQWCGPCKLMAPKFQVLAEENLDVVFLKLDCNQDNRPLAKELGIKVVPTFKIFKEGKVIKEVTGAKFDDLAYEIEQAKSS
ncbi:hypothetical protein LUZ60_014901 [Juncus effusus]|nr:hypothetical protein LUZ60_014901 [Juncus effusus]